MEMHCPGFEATVRRLLETDGVLLIGSVAAPRHGHAVPLAEEIKARSDDDAHFKPSTRDEDGRGETNTAASRLAAPKMAGVQSSSGNGREGDKDYGREH